MSASLSNRVEAKLTIQWGKLALFSLWMLLGFGIAQVVLSGVVFGLDAIGVPLRSLNQSVLSAVFAAAVYVLSLVVVIGLPRWVKRHRTTLSDTGLQRLPSWADIGLAPLGFIAYFIVSALLTLTVTALIPGFDISQPQETGFSNLTSQYEYLLAFLTLVVLAPVAEEILFRGYLYGKLRRVAPVWLVILIVSVLFGVVHGQWNVAVDVFVLSVVLCVLREITGSIWAGILLHMVKNGVAFYFLFVNPSLLNIMGG
jgi:membrane protease YdiL (CAAX protease family)